MTKPAGKYELKDLYREIDLYDRKIAYCRDHEAFDSEPARAAALQKLVTKRESLVKSAQDAAKRGIECDPRYLPRSFSQPSVEEKSVS